MMGKRTLIAFGALLGCLVLLEAKQSLADCAPYSCALTGRSAPAPSSSRRRCRSPELPSSIR